MATSLGTFWTPLFALPRQTSFFLPPPSRSWQPQQHCPCHPNHKATQVPRRSRRHGHQTMNNDKVSPPSPLLFANPRTRCPMTTQCRPGRTWRRQQQATTMTGNDNDNDGRQRQWQRWHKMTTACHDEVAIWTAARVHHHHHPPTAHHHYHQRRRGPTSTTTTNSNNGPLPAPTNGDDSPPPPTTNGDNGPSPHTQRTATRPPPAPTNSDNPLWTMNTAHHDPLPMANMAYHDPMPMANTTHHLPLPTARMAQHQHPHGAPHPTNGEHRPPSSTTAHLQHPPTARRPSTTCQWRQRPITTPNEWRWQPGTM